MAKDKWIHFAAGAVVALATVLATHDSTVAFLTSVAAACGKELYDFISNKIAEHRGQEPAHSVEILDFAATVAGGAAACMIYLK